uniref:Uncharacterized protein n=1 Tax=Pelusios castaneus TaxID=367368 RepID=A0A8C8RIS4_9SAUR
MTPTLPNSTTAPLSALTPTSNTTTAPTSNGTTTPHGNTTTAPTNNVTSSPHGNTASTTTRSSNKATTSPNNMTTLPLNTSGTTPAPLHFFLSFRIINWDFNDSLLDLNSSYYQALNETIRTLIVCSCRRKSRGKLDLFSSQDSYQPMSEYPTYHTHGRFIAPGKKHSSYSEVSSWCPDFT